MDYEDGVISVDQKHNLKEASAGLRTPHQVALVVLNQRKRGASSTNDILSFFRSYAMVGDVLHVPFVPPKLQEPPSGPDSINYI